MSLSVEAAPNIAECLDNASAARRWYPFSKDVIDWSVPLNDEWSYMPKGHSVFSGTGLKERLDQRARSFLERWEMTQLMRDVAHGEHLLKQGILALLWYADPYDPSYRYLLHKWPRSVSTWRCLISG
ncbi:MAG: hypothetical protein HKL80_04620 [Acidimicrobiales bacterium]|nr:hypothetical protein [Acidimicrobiales bacterium]